MPEYLDNNGLRYYHSRARNTFVEKESGKGLSSNDYTAADKSKLDGLVNIKTIGTGLNLSEGGTLSATAESGGTADTVEWSGVTGTPTTVAGYGITDAYTKGEVDGLLTGKANLSEVTSTYARKDSTYSKEEVDGKLSTIYKPAGSVTFLTLPSPSAANVGFVYNVTDAFTTNENFITAGQSYPLGTNVVVIAVDDSVFKYDVLAGFVDLSGFVKTTDITAIGNDTIDSIFSS